MEFGLPGRKRVERGGKGSPWKKFGIFDRDLKIKRDLKVDHPGTKLCDIYGISDVFPIFGPKFSDRFPKNTPKSLKNPYNFSPGPVFQNFKPFLTQLDRRKHYGTLSYCITTASHIGPSNADIPGKTLSGKDTVFTGCSKAFQFQKLLNFKKF